jgi:pimeloyl-ACP methyl ester carboxylesterase
MPTQTGFADVNGTRLYYEVAGSGHPLVLIHGFTLDTRMWEDQCAVFARQYQVLRYDLRGFGKSAVPTDVPYTHPDDLHALMAHLGIEHAYIIGLSLGGAVAARLVEMVTDYSGWHLLNTDPGQVLNPPAMQRLETITAPTLVIVGERDVVDFHRIAEILARGIPGAKKVVMPGVGHMANMEDPTRFNALVLAFLADN